MRDEQDQTHQHSALEGEEPMMSYLSLSIYRQLILAGRRCFISDIATHMLSMLQKITPYLCSCEQPYVNPLSHENRNKMLK